MRFRIGAALIAATMLPLFAAPAADAATTPKITWEYSKGPKVDAGSKVTINYTLASLPKNSHVELRRETGTAHVMKKVVALKAVNGTASVATTTPTQGRGTIASTSWTPRTRASATPGTTSTHTATSASRSSSPTPLTAFVADLPVFGVAEGVGLGGHECVGELLDHRAA
ncbi:hypothetical protein ACWC3X_44445, partial [Streptomyces populi]